ncbi:MAG: hypothetical protein ACLUOI_27770 [Eisenbergiella sp.]
MDETNGSYCGIGRWFHRTGRQASPVSVFEGSPASGIRPGDITFAVGDTEVTGWI